MAIVGCWEQDLAAGLRVLRVASTSVDGWLKGDLHSWAFALDSRGEARSMSQGEIDDCINQFRFAFAQPRVAQLNR
jgi:hypothetical protein